MSQIQRVKEKVEGRIALEKCQYKTNKPCHAQSFQQTYQEAACPVEEIQHRQFADEIQRLQYTFHRQPYHNKHQQHTDDVDADIRQKSRNIRLQAFHIQQMINHRIIVFHQTFLQKMCIRDSTSSQTAAWHPNCRNIT